MAAFQKTSKLARAFIEVKDRTTKQINRPFHVNGADFVRFKWLAEAKADALASGEARLNCVNVGLTLVTRDLEATFFMDGRTPKIKRLENQSYNYAGLK